jgi:phosphoglycerate dehydrogenase-like enzyme
MNKSVLIHDARSEKYKALLQPGFPEVSFLTSTTQKEAVSLASSVQAIFALGHLFNDELVSAAPKLEWVQALTTGVDAILGLNTLGDNVLVASCRGIHGPQMSEMAFLHMLNLTRDYARMHRNQADGVWDRWPQSLLYKKTAVILGVGVIAEALAKRCKAFDMIVYGISSTPRKVDGIDRMFSRDEMAQAVSEADYFILLVPHAPETDKIVDAKVIALMKPGAYLINLARGGVVDEDALLEALKEERIAGAGIDVFSRQPLPPDHSFWVMPNVLITPNLGGMSDIYQEQVLPTLETNLRHFLKGHTDQFINTVER